MTQHSTSPTVGATSAQLKADIDAGRTGDKVNNADPGLSPLGTDDEAAGNPVSPERIGLARAIELEQGAQAGPPMRDTHPAGRSVWIMAGVIVAVAVVVVLAVLLR